MDKTKTAAIYARYSSSNQREESIDAQLRICRKYAEENGYSIVKEYTDSAISGRTDQRPAFQQMIQDSAKGGFDTLLIYSHDRFSRNKYDTATYKTRLKKNGVRIVAVTLPLDDSPESGLMESIMEGFAQYYSENLARSTKRGLEENALRCKSNGPLPYGYKSENGEIVLDPLPAKVVNLIYQLYSEGYGKKMICNTLNRNGYRTNRGGEFKVNALHTILSNERYKGIYIYDNKRIEGGMPAIVSEELFDKVQNQVKRNRRARKAMKDENEYLLNGKAFCGECGSPLVGESGRSSTGEVYRYYKCAARKKDPQACQLHTERKEELEDFVVGYICREVLTDENIQLIAEKEFALLEEEAADKSLLMALQAEYKQVSAKVENILEAIEQGIFTPKTKDRLLELESRQTELEDKIVREKLKKPEFTADHIAYWLTKFRQGDIKDFEFRRAVINALVNSVFVYDDDTDPNKKGRIIIALNIKNGPVKTLTRSDVQQMGRLTRFERASDGATIRCVNHFTTTAMCLSIIRNAQMLVKDKIQNFVQFFRQLLMPASLCRIQIYSSAQMTEKIPLKVRMSRTTSCIVSRIHPQHTPASTWVPAPRTKNTAVLNPSDQFSFFQIRLAPPKTAPITISHRVCTAAAPTSLPVCVTSHGPVYRKSPVPAAAEIPREMNTPIMTPSGIPRRIRIQNCFFIYPVPP